MRSRVIVAGAVKRIRITMAVICLMMFVGLVATASAAGAVQISGEAFLFPGHPDGFPCERTEFPGDFAPNFPYGIPLVGDLEGCLYIQVEEIACSPSGTYRERGKEFYDIFGGDLEKVGTFMTTYLGTVKWDGPCPPDETSIEIWGRCQHPIIAGSGSGDFEFVTGRLDFKDFPDEGPFGFFPYRGHVRWPNMN